MNNTDFDRRILSMKDRIFRLAKSMLGDRAEAEDAMQDILEKLWRQRNEIGGYSNVEAFVYTSTRNYCIDRIRSRNTRLEKAGSIAYESQRVSEISREIEARDMKSAVAAIIATLPDRQQMVIHLRDIEELGFDEISEATGMDETNVRVALSRARKAVREQLIKIMNHGIQ